MSSARIVRPPVPSVFTRPNSLHGTVPLSIPEIDEALVTYLSSIFPDSLAAVEGAGSYDRALGRLDVVRHIRALWEDQQNKD